MKKAIGKVLLFLLGIVLSLSSLGIFALVVINQKHTYNKTYYAALVDKFHHLKSHKNDKKIILIGGSNVAFGFDSKLIEEEFPEYKVVNFGLYAMLGTKIMMDLAFDYINKDDLVFLIPEINEQSTSLYFNVDATLKAIEDDYFMIKHLREDNKKEVLDNSFNYFIERGKQQKVIEPTGVYQRKNFNEYGDISYPDKDEQGIAYRSTNRLVLHYDPTMMVDYSYDIDQSFYDYVNEYDYRVNQKGAKLYYSFSPVNEPSVTNLEDVSEYYWKVREHLNCQVVGNPNSYIIDSHYFYDSNFHLNDAGATYRTYQFVSDVYRDIFLNPKAPKFDIPVQPDYVEISLDNADDDPNANYFTLRETDAGYVVTGLSEEALEMKELRLPMVYHQKYVIGVVSRIFVGSKV